MDETLIDDRHGVARLLEEEDRVANVDLVCRLDRVQHEGEIPAHESTRGASGLGGARHIATDASRRTWSCKCREQGSYRWIARARDQIVHGGSMEDAHMRAAHEPEMQRGDVRVADERFWIALE